MKQITKRLMIVCLAVSQCLMVLAQFGDPREKLSITATVDGATNTDYRRKTEDGQLMENGRIRRGVDARLQIGLRLLGSQHFSLSFNPFYNFSTRSLKPDDGSPQPQLPIPDAHHHYGGGFTGTYNTQWLGKPFTIFAIADYEKADTTRPTCACMIM